MFKRIVLGLLSAVMLVGCAQNDALVRNFDVNGISFKMIYVEGGSFVMGSSEQSPGAEGDEFPAHNVSLDGFYIGETEVTQELWMAVMGGNNPSGFTKNPSDTTLNALMPVESVTWFQCLEFIDSLNSLTGATFRMPTEAEWEFAARGGNLSKGFLYSGSNNIDEVAWYGVSDKEGITHPVGQKLPNELGLYDMSGNVWEWCSDWYAPYTAEDAVNPSGPAEGRSRVIRGGCWFVDAPVCRPSDRSLGSPRHSGCILGLRLAM